MSIENEHAMTDEEFFENYHLLVDPDYPDPEPREDE